MTPCNCTRLVKEWLHAVALHDVNAVLTKYDRNAILVATLAPAPLRGKAITNYFQDFLSKPFLYGQLDEIFCQRLTSTECVASGLYTFHYVESNRQWVSVPARFTYVFRKTPRGWLIVHHHSSKVP
jgi:uncharacterized protein (TIGR02246 family)